MNRIEYAPNPTKTRKKKGYSVIFFISVFRSPNKLQAITKLITMDEDNGTCSVKLNKLMICIPPFWQGCVCFKEAKLVKVVTEVRKKKI